MAQHILDRVAASLRPDSRITDCRKTLAAAEQECAAIDGRIAEAERNSTDPSVADEDSREAWQRAEDFRLLKRRLERAIRELRVAITAKEEARRSEERATAYAEAKTARDALTERWRLFGEAYGQFVQLLSETHDNDQLLAIINRALPEGGTRLRSAEVEARGVANEARWPNGEPFRRLTSLEWDNFDRSGFAWSVVEAERRALAAREASAAADHAAVMATRAAENTPKALAAKAAAEAARYSPFTVRQARYSGAGRIRVAHRDGVAGIGDEPATLWLHADQVEAATESGLVVEPASERELVVLPSIGDRASARSMHELVQPS
jgi:hypothetical protein